MEEIIEWDDSEVRIMDIFASIEVSEDMQIPIKCPICNTHNAHIYMHRWENGRGTVWTWCSSCKACTHGSRMELPGWWENADFIDIPELTSHPVFLELKADTIDNHLRKLLRNRN